MTSLPKKIYRADVNRAYSHYLADRSFVASSLLAIFLLLTSLVINFYAGVYATEKASNAVTDIILSNTRVFDVDGAFVYGPMIFWAIIGVLCLKTPQRIPYTAKSIALFVLIRSLFITLTHIGPFPTHLAIHSSVMERFSPGADLFFSGHVGSAFLVALIFWDHPRIRLFALGASVVFAAVVLLAHLHYSIDVLSAFFITYSIYRLAEFFFKKDRRLFAAGLER